MSFDAICVTVSILTSFFCHSNVIDTVSAYSSQGFLCSSTLPPFKNLTFLNLSMSVYRFSVCCTFRYSSSASLDLLSRSRLSSVQSDPVCNSVSILFQFGCSLKTCIRFAVGLNSDPYPGETYVVLPELFQGLLHICSGCNSSVVLLPLSSQR